MSGFPILAAPTQRLSVPSRQYYRNASGSPTRQQQQHFQQHVDDLISQLTPTTAVSALRFPTGPLKACLDTATASEQSFAMRAALAASSMQEWLEELSEWQWPEGGGSAGFEQPESGVEMSSPITTTPKMSPPSSRTLSPSTPKTPEGQIMRAVARTADSSSERDSGGGLWMGSLPASKVARYEARITEIRREIEDLEVEDMKRHVLHHHILPLSPPGTPLMDGQLRASSSGSMATFTRMDDLTAVVTAIVLQTLPLISRLTRLLDVWRIRLLVLKKIPVLLAALGAAEASIQSAWNAIRLGDKDDKDGKDGKLGHSSSTGAASSLRREEFVAMKSVVEGKVSRAAQITDFMLDSLDGWEDTIPEYWIDRIDAAERDYGEWVAVCERKIRESDWKKVTLNRPALSPPVQARNLFASISFPAVEAATETPMTTAQDSEEELAQVQQARHMIDAGPVADNEEIVDAEELSPVFPRTPPRVLSAQNSLESLREPELPSFNLSAPLEGNGSEPISPSVSIIHVPSDALLPSETDFESDYPVSRGVSGRPEDVRDLDDVTNLPEFDDTELVMVEASPPSSPPDFRTSVRSTITFNDMPTVAEIPGEESPTAPKTPVEASFVFDDITNDEIDLPQDMDSPSSSASIGSRRMSVTSEDDQLQQQISEILESIPAKIHLSSQPSPTYSHLNPPDFKLPSSRKPKSAADNTRSLSSMSSRSMTPSFLLAPAYTRNNPRPRQQRGNQDIKLYHLSRSTGEAPIKLFIRLVGESGERVMVRVGGGWADLSEYLKEYASHHSRRSKSGGESKIEIRDLPITLPTSSSVATSLNSRVGSSPPSRPASALDSPAVAMAPLKVRKTRKVTGDEGSSLGSSRGNSIGSSFRNRSNSATGSVANNGSNTTATNKNPRTPLASMAIASNDTPPSEASTRSRSSSRLSWTEEDSSLGMSGPRAKNIEMSEESKAWVESVKERVRIASGERRVSDHIETGKFGEIGRVGGTKRLFRKGQPVGKGAGDKKAPEKE